ncbi:competence type IV pilus major pilin ComGC [Desulfosporosinus hippei]|uniref:General secretion pathway protein G n=1 Tax=Desulfosporosinus hippei DSM 8344 TaxID=1121419 RepID=A0A1G8GBM2_9FIRM|nr:type II secretion system protein GspG [Desulfosporosinus hippei]SDH91812.1 general secretion pathway protein G [Desulfosporosinus hippei DSM 8344]
MGKQSGFTLWEVLIVLFLMGVLLTTFSQHFGSASKTVQKHINQANIQRIEGAAQLYKIDVGTYPSSVRQLVHNPESVRNWQGPYLDEIPINPFDSELEYEIDSTGKVSDSMTK